MSQSSEYQVNIVVKTTDKTSAPAKKAAKGMDLLKTAAKATAVAFAAIKAAKVVAEFVKIGAAAERQEKALNNLAAAAGSSGDEIIKSIQMASDFTIDRMSAMQAANRAMVMDVAKSPEEFERLTKVAVALGRAMGQDATKSIDDFVTAGGRQSKLIADNLGLIVNAADAQERYAAANNTTVDAMDDAAKKQAFLTEMLRQGELKMLDLGDGALDNAAKIEQASAAWADFRTNLGEIAVNAAEATGALEGLAETTGHFAQLTELVKEYGWSWRAAAAYSDAGFSKGDAAALDAYSESVKAAAERRAEYAAELENSQLRMDEYNAAMVSASSSEDTFTAKQNRAAFVAAIVSDTMGDSADRFGDYQDAMEEAEKSETRFIDTTLELAAAQREAMLAAMDAAETHLETAAVYTGYQESIAESVKDSAKRREDIETKHAENVAKIQKKGQGWSEKVDEEGMRLELRIARGRLAELLKKQSEYNDETTDLQRARTEKSIRGLEEEIAEKTGVLQVANDGYVQMAGKNVDDLLKEEDRLYNESLADLEASQADKERAQQKSLGKMVLQHFNAWSEMNLAADGLTKQEVDYITATRKQISEQYELTTDSAIEEMEKQEAEWKRTMAIMAGDAAGFFDYFMQQFNALPGEKVMRIRTELSERPEDIPGRVSEQSGGGGAVSGSTTIIQGSRDTLNFHTAPAARAALTGKRRRYISRLM